MEQLSLCVILLSRALYILYLDLYRCDCSVLGKSVSQRFMDQFHFLTMGSSGFRNMHYVGLLMLFCSEVFKNAVFIRIYLRSGFLLYHFVVL